MGSVPPAAFGSRPFTCPIRSKGQVMTTDKCAKCGFPGKEHGYNGACYGLCGEFVEQQSPATIQTAVAAAIRGYCLMAGIDVQSSGGIERIYYAGLSINGLAKAIATAIAQQPSEPLAWRWRHVNDASEKWHYQEQPIVHHNEYLIVEPLYAVSAQTVDATASSLSAGERK